MEEQLLPILKEEDDYAGTPTRSLSLNFKMNV